MHYQLVVDGNFHKFWSKGQNSTWKEDFYGHMMTIPPIFYQISSMGAGGTSFHQWKHSRDQIL